MRFLLKWGKSVTGFFWLFTSFYREPHEGAGVYEQFQVEYWHKLGYFEHHQKLSYLDNNMIIYFISGQKDDFKTED